VQLNRIIEDRIAETLPHPFPFEALPKPIGEYAQELSEKIETADSIAGSAALAVCSLLVQGKGNIVTNFGDIPLSLFLLTVADSGERKSTIEKMLLHPIEKKEEDFYERYWIEHEKSLDNLKDWVREKDKAIKEKNHDDLADLYENKPEVIQDPKILVTDPTIAGLFKQYEKGRPSLGMFPNEGATMFGGHSLRTQSTSTVGHLSNLWDGKPIEKTRGSKKESIKLFNKRLTVNLMVQPIIFDKVWNNTLFQTQGILARFLICKPTPKTGTRVNMLDIPRFQHRAPYCRRVNELLEEIIHPRKSVKLEISPQANKRNIEFYKEVELQSGLSGKYHGVRFFASKSAEQARRIAGVISLFENSEAEEIDEVDMERGVCLSHWYLEEVLRINNNENLEENQKNEDIVIGFLEKRESASTRDMLRVISPRYLRKSKELLPVLHRLESSGKIIRKNNKWFLKEKGFM